MTRTLLALALAMIPLARPARAQAPAAPARVVGYLASWKVSTSGNYRIEDIPADRLTHINYAFALIDKDGNVVPDDAKAAFERPVSDDKSVKGVFAGLRRLKAKYPGLKTLASIGGWGGSGRFSDVALTDTSRATFARSCADFALKNGFDGVDIDWEYPVSGGLSGNARRPEDKANFTRLLAAIRKEFDARGKADGHAYLLTVAAPSSNANRIELKEVAATLDWINLMSYDFSGSWSKASAFDAPLFDPEGPGKGKENVDASVRSYLAAGVPRDKLVVGVPFYGRGWVVADTMNDGLGRPPFPDAPRGMRPGFSVSYRTLATRYPAALRHWNDRAKAPYLLDPASRLWIGYDDAESVRLKADYVRQHHLGGLMIWELSDDDPKGTLIRAMTDRPTDR